MYCATFVSAVRHAELRALGLLVRKGLHHAHARQGVLKLRIHLGDLGAVIGKHAAHMQVLSNHKRHEHNRGQCESTSELRRDGEEDGQGADDLDTADDDPFGQVMRALTDVEEVVDHAAHHVARVMGVKVGEAEALVLVEQVLAHARLHASTHDVPLCGDEINACRTNDIKPHEPEPQEQKPVHDGRRALGEQPTRQRAQDNRKRQVDPRIRQRADRVGDKQPLLGPVI